MDLGHDIVNSLYFLEGWGRALRRRDGVVSVVAWSAVVFVVAVMLVFYKMVNKQSSWAALWISLIMDAGTNFVSLAIILIGPVASAVGLFSSRTSFSEHSNDEEAALLSSRRPESHFVVPHSDWILRIHAGIFALCVVTSCASDIAIAHFDGKRSTTFAFFFVFADILENSLYGGGFLWLAVAYRVIALRVWAILEQLERLRHSQDRVALVEMLPIMRQAYEEAFDASEIVSDTTSKLALLLMALVIIEMVSTVDEIFVRDTHFVWDLTHMAMLRLVLILTLILLQVALAAADVMYSSELLAQCMARLEAELRDTGDNSVQRQADLLKALGYRVRNFPVRLSVGWFHLTTEWSMGIATLIITVLLTMVGIKLPGGE